MPLPRLLRGRIWRTSMDTPQPSDRAETRADGAFCPAGFDTDRLRREVLAQYERVATAPTRGDHHFHVGGGYAAQALGYDPAEHKTYCVYLAESEALIHEHAKRSGFPADRIEAVRTVIDPSLAPA
jgi:hypothetical protein